MARFLESQGRSEDDLRSHAHTLSVLHALHGVAELAVTPRLAKAVCNLLSPAQSVLPAPTMDTVADLVQDQLWLSSLTTASVVARVLPCPYRVPLYPHCSCTGDQRKGSRRFHGWIAWLALWLALWLACLAEAVHDV